MIGAVDVLGGLVLAATAVGAAAWCARLAAVVRLRVAAPTTGATGRVSIIVPARDEAANLPALLASLGRLDPPPHQLIVVDDHSTDGTGDLARAAGATVIVPPPLPPGWLGKPWACHHGAAAATGDWLLFTDADTVHAPDALAIALGRATAADLVSVIPTHAVVRGWERLQGAFHLLLLVATCAGGDDRRRRFSIGQYLMFRRAAYDQIGGHAAIRGRTAEDLALAERIVDAGLTYRLLHRPGLLGVRMYPGGVGDFARGWRRSFRDGLAATGTSGGAEMIAVIGWLAGAPLLAAIAALTGHLGWLAIAGATCLATAAAIAAFQREVGPLPWWGALAYPAATLAFIGISAAAAIDHLRRAPVRWRGRAIPLDRLARSGDADDHRR